MTAITSIKGREVFDSRGNPTVEVEMSTETHSVRAIAPSGASTGSHEAVELRDGGSRYCGKGVQQAVTNVNKQIAQALLGKDCTNQREIDDALIKLDGSDNKCNLGSNATVAVSMAACKLGALSKNIPLYRHIAAISGRSPRVPVPFCNIINGGAHAGNALALQEFMIVPSGAESFTEGIRLVAETYQELKKILVEKYGKEASNVGDEGGFAPPVNTADEALSLLTEAVKKLGYEDKITFAIDAAASEFFAENVYHMEKAYASQQLSLYYQGLVKKYPLISLEDPFSEDEFEAFTDCTAATGIQIVADDLTVTNPKRIETAAVCKAANCLLLKVNQIGTVSEAIDAALLSFKHDWNVMVSHRSGETEDTFIADLATGLGCGQLKSGAPCRSERTAKYNRLIRIEEEIGSEGYGL